MYFNDIHILIYVAIAVAGFFIGKFVNWCNYRLPEYQKVFSKEIFKTKEIDGYKPNLLLSLITMLIYILLLYVLGIQKTFLGNLQLIKYLILRSVSTFIITRIFSQNLLPPCTYSYSLYSSLGIDLSPPA